MATYVALLNFTERGIQNVKETTKRYEQAKALGDKMGVKITQMFYTLGPYDCVTVLDAKDEDSLTAFMLATSSQGNVRTVSMRAYTPAEFDRVLAKV